VYHYLQGLDPRLRQVLLVAPLLLVVALGYRLLLAPDLRSYRSLRASRLVLEEAMENGSEISAELAELRQVVEGLRTRVFGKDMDMPMRELEAHIIGRLQVISSRHHVQFQSVRPGTRKKRRAFMESPVEVEVTGGYFDVAAWLRALNDELGFTVVRDYELQPVGSTAASGEDPTMRMRLTMVSYRMAES
jgi:Tfp pilus assembly protein PilO